MLRYLEHTVLEAELWIHWVLVELIHRFFPGDLPREDERREVGFPFVDAELLKEVEVLEPFREHALPVLFAIGLVSIPFSKEMNCINSAILIIIKEVDSCDSLDPLIPVPLE